MNVQLRRILCLASIVLSAPVAGQSAQDVEPVPEAETAPEATVAAEPNARLLVTLDEVLERAGAQSPLVAIEDAQIEMAAMRRLEARWSRMPSIRLDFVVAPSPRVDLETDPETGELDPFSNRDSDAELLESIIGGAGLGLRTELTAVVPITTFGKIRLARQLADVGVDVQQLERDVAVRESRFAALRAYLTVQWYVEVNRVLTEAEERLDLASEELEFAIDDGDRTARTALRQLTIARTEFVELRGEADGLGILARHALVQTLGLPTTFRADPLDETVSDAAPPSLDDVLSFARGHRPDYALLDSASQAADLQRMLRWRALAPDIYFSARVAHAWTPTVDDVSGPFINDPYNRFGFGFWAGLRWNMNPATRVAQARRADAQAAAVSAQQTGAWLAIEMEVAEAYYEAASKSAVLASYDDALRAANAWLNQAQFQYDQGLAEFSDLKEPMETYYRTMGSYYEALLRYRMAVADLALKCGADDLLSWPGGE